MAEAEKPDADEETSGIGEAPGAGEIGRSRGHGLAIGLAFALLLILDDPAGVVTLIAHGGDVCVGTIVLTFGIGATFTGAIFILTEDR